MLGPGTRIERQERSLTTRRVYPVKQGTNDQNPFEVTFARRGKAVFSHGCSASAVKRFSIKRARFAAGLALKQGSTDGVYLCSALLLATNQVANILAVIGVMASLNLALDPSVLLVRNGDGFSYRCHEMLSDRSEVVRNIILLVRFCAPQMSGQRLPIGALTVGLFTFESPKKQVHHQVFLHQRNKITFL